MQEVVINIMEDDPIWNLPVSNENVGWSKDMDEMMIKLAEQCQCWEWLCIQSAQQLESRISILNISSFVCSVGVTACQMISTQVTLASNDNRSIAANVINSFSLASSIGLTVLSTLQIVLNDKNNSVKFRSASASFRKLYSRLVTLLNVPLDKRPLDSAATYLAYFSQYNKEVESVPTVPGKIRDLFNKKFGTSKISRPIAVGDVQDLELDQDGHGIVYV